MKLLGILLIGLVVTFFVTIHQASSYEERWEKDASMFGVVTMWVFLFLLWTGITLLLY
jgi:hypothetical protein